MGTDLSKDWTDGCIKRWLREQGTGQDNEWGKVLSPLCSYGHTLSPSYDSSYGLAFPSSAVAGQLASYISWGNN